ncbi:hypothetical protein BaRGS_00031885 [Batillaria attramentaria]|uniref:Uncharacterized protein n=1 Tax=Batillaria attramentaria TaxID=370345 RepID=A0ABD0JQU7_9CAEN
MTSQSGQIGAQSFHILLLADEPRLGEESTTSCRPLSYPSNLRSQHHSRASVHASQTRLSLRHQLASSPVELYHSPNTGHTSCTNTTSVTITQQSHRRTKLPGSKEADSAAVHC